MTIRLEILKTGAGKKYWSYNLFIDDQFVSSCPKLIYRMWDKEATALRNGIKFLNEYINRRKY
jgi:hypothetical protein